MKTAGNISVVETYMTPTLEYPYGSYMRQVAGVVEVATGYYATLHPGKPSLYWHGGPPFVVFAAADWKWE